MKYYVSAGLKTLSFFLILPIATQNLPKAEVGKFFFWIAVIQLGAGITSMGFSSAVARRSYNRDITDYVTAVGVLTALLAWMVVCLIGSVAGVLSVAVIIAWLARSLSLIGEARTIARAELGKLSAIYGVYAMVFPIVGLLFVVRPGASYESLLAGFAVAEFLVAFGGLYTLQMRLRANFAIARARYGAAIRKAGAYGLPIMIAGMANMGLNSADRFIVAGFWDFEVVAEFSIMYTIAFASSRFITAPANMKIFPEFVRGHTDAVAVGRIRAASGLAWLVSATYCVTITVLGPVIVRLLLSTDYEIDHADFALVSGASSLFLLFTISSAHLKIRNRTTFIMYILFAALSLSIVISMFLVPVLGYRGASYSTFLTYSSLAAWSIFSLRPVLFKSLALAVGAAMIALSISWALIT